MQPDELITQACALFAVTREQLLGDARARHVAQARQALMYALSRRTTLSHTAIGQLLEREHTTVGHGIAAARSRAAVDARYAAQVAELLAWTPPAPEPASEPSAPVPAPDPDPAPAGRRLDAWWIGLAGYVHRGVRLSA